MKQPCSFPALRTFCLCTAIFTTFNITASFSQCTCTPGYLCVPDGSLASTYGSNFGTSPVYLEGTFTVDQNFSISGVYVRCNSNAGIFINSGKTLTIDQNSILTLDPSCSGLWRGIYNSGTLNLTSSTVELALDALTCYNGSTYTITDATFNRNYEAIVYSGISGTYSGTCIGTYFQCLNGTTAVAIGYSPYSTVRSHVGIDVTGVSLVNVGDNSTLDANTFDNLDYGIYSGSTGVDSMQNSTIFIAVTMSPFQE